MKFWVIISSSIVLTRLGSIFKIVEKVIKEEIDKEIFKDFDIFKDQVNLEFKKVLKFFIENIIDKFIL